MSGAPLFPPRTCRRRLRRTRSLPQGRRGAPLSRRVSPRCKALTHSDIPATQEFKLEVDDLERARDRAAAAEHVNALQQRIDSSVGPPCLCLQPPSLIPRPPPRAARPSSTAKPSSPPSARSTPMATSRRGTSSSRPRRGRARPGGDRQAPTVVRERVRGGRAVPGRIRGACRRVCVLTLNGEL